jgi:Family of unknown function (DUF6632)
MEDRGAVKVLRVALVVIGVVFVIGVYPLTVLWPSGWIWHTSGHSEYLQMILGVYATLGIFLIRASQRPFENLSLIWFTVWSSVVHAGIMGAQAVAEPEWHGHLIGDVPVLLLVAIVLAVLTARAERAPAATA